MTVKLSIYKYCTTCGTDWDAESVPLTEGRTETFVLVRHRVDEGCPHGCDEVES